MNKKKRVAVFSKGISRKNELRVLLDIDEMLFKPRNSSLVDYVVGWGRKPNTEKARIYAKRNNLEYYSLEDGFIHSMGQGVLGATSCSLIKDSLGIYYDATQTSDLEVLLSSGDKKHFNSDIITRAKSAIQRISLNHISKYNNGSLHLDDSIFHADEVVLVIDQTAGDMSLKYGYVVKNTFDEMLQTALVDYPDAQIIVKTHPDVVVGKKKGNINLKKLDSRITVISDAINPIVLLKKVDVVYVATSQMGFEALMLGKRVVCFGVPFYAGWGVTEDRADKSLVVWNRRKKKRTIDELFAAAYIHYSLYKYPDSQMGCELEDVLIYFESQNTNKFITSADNEFRSVMINLKGCLLEYFKGL